MLSTPIIYKNISFVPVRLNISLWTREFIILAVGSPHVLVIVVTIIGRKNISDAAKTVLVAHYLW